MILPKRTLAARPSRGLRYHVAIVCLWEEPDVAQSTWRFSLERLHPADRRAFASLEALTQYLREWMATAGDGSL